MIKYNNSDIKDWNYGTSNIVKVYHNNAICFYKVTESHSQTPCYAVVDNISQYQETEFEDVYDKATEKWYKLNNLNQYEEYGLYGSGRNITYYEGKLTIDDGYEYQYSGGSWVNIGEVSGGDEEYPEYYEDKQEPPTMVTFATMEEALAYPCPYVGLRAKIGGDNYVFNDQYQWEYTPLPYDAEVQYLENDGTQYINTNAYIDISTFEIGFTINGTDSVFGYVHQGVGSGTWLGSEKTNMFFGRFINSLIVNMSSYLTPNENTIVFTKNGVTVNGTTISNAFRMGNDSIANNPLLFFTRWDFNKKAVEFVGNTHFKFKSFYLKNNGNLVVDMIAVRVGQVGYMYDRVSQQLFPNAGSGNFIVGSDIN